MNYRLVTESDYQTLCEWWSFWRFPAPDWELLSTTGVLVFDDEGLICVGFLYGTNSKISWIEFIVSNPNVKDKTKRKEAINFLIDTMCLTAKASGFSVVFSSLKNQNLINKYKDCGFIEGSNNCVELIKKL